MCGIAGVVRFGASALEHDPGAGFDRALAHRGPDGHGRFASACGRAVFVHRRLAIIDPTEASNQPITDGSGRWHMVYNGEIYNFRELRAELGGEGVSFSTQGDTEVLLQLVVRRGPAALAAARGMFALALWDAAEGSLLVARDRFGIKPLYVARKDDCLSFASELRALRDSGAATAIARPAVLAFLRWGSIPPPLAWCEDVEALEPGSWRRWNSAGIESSGRFATLSWTDAPRAQPGGEVEQSIARAIRDSVSAHLVSDVPVALFLSGGLDSATLLAAAADVGHRLDCFTVADTAHDDETRAAEAIVTSFGARWHRLRLETDNIGAVIPRAVQRLDQPSIDGPNAWMIAGAVAAAGVKTALSGTGADELFGGYPTSRLLPLWARLGAATPLAARGVASLERLRRHPVRAARLEHVAAHTELKERYRAVRGLFLPHELDCLLGPRLAGSEGASAAQRVDAVEQALLATRDEPMAASVARAETQVYLRSQLLRDLDVMSMAHGLEVRVPFVDHVLLERTWPLITAAPRLLARKRILKRMLRGRVPAQVVERRKTGFTLPFDRWMHRELADFTRAGIDAAERSGWIAAHAGEAIWREWQRGRQHWSRPWGLAVLGHHVTLG